MQAETEVAVAADVLGDTKRWASDEKTKDLRDLRISKEFQFSNATHYRQEWKPLGTIGTMYWCEAVRSKASKRRNSRLVFG